MDELEGQLPLLGMPEHLLQGPERINNARIIGISEIIAESAELVSMLESSDKPDTAHHEYIFHGEALHGVQLPSYIADSLLTREIQHIMVVCDEVATSDAINPSIQLQIEAGNVDDHTEDVSITLPINRHEPLSSGTFYDHASNKEKPVTVTTGELRQTIASAIIPIIDGDYEKFSDLDMHDDDIYYALTTLLREKASGHLSDATYYFGPEGDRTGWLQYIATNGELVMTDIHNIRKKDQAISANGEFIDDEVAVAAQISSEAGQLGVSFYQTEGAVGTVGRSTEFEPELSDILILRELIQGEKSKIPQIPIVPFEERHSPQAE